MNAIAPITPAGSVESPPPESLLNCVAFAMRDPSTDVSKLELLYRLQREIVAEEARIKFAQAMRAAQAEMQPILRTAQNTSTNSKYAPLEVIDAVIRPIYTKHGFGMEFDSEPIEGGVRLICEINHDGGHMKTRRLEAALDSAGPQGRANKTPVQALVSSTTYLRRTLTCMVWNIAMTNEDNDGNRQKPVNDGRITDAQAEEMHDLMTRGRIREGTVIEKMCPGLRSVTQLPAADFGRVRNALLSRLNVLEQRAAAERAATARQTHNGDARP
jgi:hypothetical protein